MSEPEQLSTVPPVSEPEAPIQAVAHPIDVRVGEALPGRRLALVMVVSIVLCVVGTIGILLPQAQPIAIPLCLSLVPLFAVALAAAIPLAALGKDDVPGGAMLAGWAVILGGAACDIVATVTRSPDLSQEANPILRALLDNGVSLPLVYLYGALTQALFIGLATVLWFGLLTHRSTLIASMPPHGSLLAYLKAGTGGRHLTYRQWTFPLTYSELPCAYHLAWFGAVACVAMSAYRFYLALEWYEYAPRDTLWVRLIAPSVLLVVACVWYAAWLRAARARLGSETT
jgi:hypothetical protein